MRILGDIERGVGFAAVNSLAKGAVFCANFCMEEPEVLRAALDSVQKPFTHRLLRDQRKLHQLYSQLTRLGFDEAAPQRSA